MEVAVSLAGGKSCKLASGFAMTVHLLDSLVVVHIKQCLGVRVGLKLFDILGGEVFGQPALQDIKM